MATATPATPTLPSAYERLGQRIQKIINAPTAQKAKAALLYKAETESADDWAQLLEEISENDNVTLAHRDDGGVQIFWIVPQDEG